MLFLKNSLVFLPILFIHIDSCQSAINESKYKSDTSEYALDTFKIYSRAKEAKTFCTKNKLNTRFCILADMSIHSGRNRFFIYDLTKDSIIYSCLVGHGCGSNPWSEDKSKDNPQFSNQENSHCSSLGKYKIGARGSSDWGIHIKYLMHGLESTNSNALKRYIVFHSWDLVSESESYPNGTPEGWGCPTISNSSMKIIDSMLQKQKLSTLLWQFN